MSEFENTFEAVSSVLERYNGKEVNKEKINELKEICKFIDALAIELDNGFFDVLINDKTGDINISLCYYEMYLTEVADLFFYIVAHAKDFSITKGETIDSEFSYDGACKLNFTFPSVFK